MKHTASPASRTFEVRKKSQIFRVIYDDCDFWLLSKYRWQIHPKGYAIAKGESGVVLMHRLILGIRSRDVMVYHKITINWIIGV